MKTIWKYTLNPYKTVYEMPLGAELLCAREQGDDICVWAKVDDEETRRVARKLIIAGTGHGIPYAETKYIGTGILQNGTLVFHVFEVMK